MIDSTAVERESTSKLGALKTGTAYERAREKEERGGNTGRVVAARDQAMGINHF